MFFCILFYTEHSYDDIGRETAAYGETGERTAEYEYFDGTRSVRSEKYAGGGVLAYGKDISDNVTAITQSTEDGEENSTLTRYDNGRVAEVKSGDTSIGYEYDDKGRTKKIKLNGSDYITCAYTEDIPNADGSDSDKVTATNAKGEVFEKVTDKSGNVQSVTYNGAEQWNATYDKNGNAKKIEDKVSGETLTFTYDKYGRAVSHTAEKDGEQTYTESVTYNEFGKATETTLGNRTYTFTYRNNAERTLEGVTTDGITFRPKTDILGRNAGRSIENADGEIACEKIHYRKAGDHATNMPQCVDFKGERITYSYDKLGNITEIKENGELQARYKYDTLGRLVREDNKKLNKTETYTYDGNGNILEKRVYGFTVIAELEGIEHETKTYLYDGDKLISYDGQACEYDAIGNPTTYRGKAVTWEKDRNMTAYDGVAFAYDGRDRRMSKGNITFSYSAGGKLIGQSNGVEFIYDGNGIAGIVYGGSTYFYRKDAQGNITALIDSNGNVVVRYMYDAWGNHTIALKDDTYNALATVNPIRYRGYYYDTEIGLYYLQTRYYDPTTGRFVTIDGIAYADPESINGLNLYAYCGNNPVMNVDPTGTLTWWQWLLGIVIIVASVALSVVTAGIATLISAALGGGMLGAIVGGAVAGAVGGAITGFGISIATQGIANGFSNINWAQVGWATLSGAVTGAIFGGIGGAVKVVNAAKAWSIGKSGSKYTNMMKHFIRHGKDMGFKTAVQYTNAAKEVIKNGTYFSAKNAFVKLAQSGKYHFVGVIRGGMEITTYSFRTFTKTVAAMLGLNV